MKKVLGPVVILLALVVGYAAAGPYLTVSAIKRGLAEQDAEKLSENIEFPTLRQNLKEQLNAAMLKNAATELKDNPFAALAAGLASKMTEGIVDSFVTPSGLATLMEGKKPTPKTHSDESTPPQEDDLFKNARYTYDSISRFSIWVPNDTGEETRFVLQREGVTWKLVNLIIPL